VLVPASGIILIAKIAKTLCLNVRPTLLIRAEELME
jgi:hypothetical protein